MIDSPSIEKRGRELAFAAENFRLIKIPQGFHDWGESRKAEWSALAVCDLKRRAADGEKAAVDFFRLHCHWQEPPQAIKPGAVPVAAPDLLPPWPPAPGRRTVHRCDVVIPYTAATLRWLAQSVESILNQAHAECVVHLIRDGEPIEEDPAESLADLPAVRWYANRKNIGPYTSVHRVWDRMETDFLAIHDSDDIALPNRIWYSIETLEQTGADILGAAMEQFLSHEAASDSLVEHLAKAPFLFSGATWKLSPDGCIINGTLVCRRAAFEKMNGFLSLKCSADLEFPTRAKRMNMKVVAVPHVLALRRLHTTSLSNGPEFQMGTANRKKAWSRIERAYRQYERPGVDFAKFGGLDHDRRSRDTLRLGDYKIDFQNLEYHVTHACNLRCESCTHYSNHGHRGYVTSEDADREFSRWSGRLRPKWFSLLGGEPTLNPGLCEIIRVAARHWPESQLQVVTNGWFLHRHPALPAVLAETGCRLEISIHGDTPQYRASVDQIRRLVDAWKVDHEFAVHWRHSWLRWERRYHDNGNGVAPFDDGDLAASWAACDSKWCPQLFSGRIWKCPQIAYLGMQSELAREPVRGQWAPYLRYKSLSPEADLGEIERFLRRESEAVCGMCPARPERFKPPCPLPKA